MNALSFREIDLDDKRAAFTGLLSSPVVAPWLDPTLYALVTRQERVLEVWCRRLGYLLVRIDRCVRLRRVPLGGEPAVPAGQLPKRRPHVLALVLAAALEDQREDSVTLQELSDAAHHATAAHGLVPYDPVQRSHRAALVAAVRILATNGVLEQRTQRGDLLDSWEREGSGIGAGYLIHRDALVLLVDTRDVEIALLGAAPTADTRSARLLRVLVETQALHPLELDEANRTYLASQRSRLVAQAEEMTGGIVEVREDSIVLVLPSDRGLDASLFVGFPEATAADWVALSLLDSTIRAGEPDAIAGRRRCSSAAVTGIASNLLAEHGSRLTVPLREGGVEAVRAAGEQKLVEAGLIEVTTEGDWVLKPEAARYRDAELTAAPVSAPPSTLFEERPGPGEEAT